MLDAIFKPLAPFWSLIGRNPYMAAMICAVLSGLAALVHSGHMLALFACLGSMILMYKNEADHPAQGMNLPLTPMD